MFITRGQPRDPGAGPNARRHSVETYLGGLIWTTKIHIPSSYEAVFLPPNQDIRNAGGSFSYKIQYHHDMLLVHYHLKLNRVVYNPEQYPALRALLLADLSAQKSQNSRITREEGTTASPTRSKKHTHYSGVV